MTARITHRRRAVGLVLSGAIIALFAPGTGVAQASATKCDPVWQTVFGLPVPIMRYSNCISVTGNSTRVDKVSASWGGLRPGEWICDYKFRISFRGPKGVVKASRTGPIHYGCTYDPFTASYTTTADFPGYGSAPWYLGDNWQVRMELFTNINQPYGPTPYVRISA
jgi:hypothetical protein